MSESRKFCFCITPRRLLGAVLIAASTVNLIIVGTAFEMTFSGAVPTISPTPTAYPLTGTFFAPATTSGAVTLSTLGPALTNTPTATPTFTATSTYTFTPTATPTATDTPTPSPTQCVPWYGWPAYIVVAGDTLSSLAAATGTTYPVLMDANCLTNTIIYVGQRLYVPRLPATATSTATPTSTTPPVIYQPGANPIRVTFPPGSVSVSMAGTIDQGRPTSYILWAYATQTLTVQTVSRAEPLTISISSNGLDLPLSGVNGQVVNQVSTKLPIDGEYIVTIRPGTTPQSPTLNFDITFTVQ